MAFIIIDNQQPINLDRIVTFKKDKDLYSDAARGQLIVFYIKSGNFFWWSFKSVRERDRAYDFLIRKTCIQYKARDKIAEILRQAKEAALKKTIDLIIRRKKPFGMPMIAGREVSLLEHHDHQKEVIQRSYNNRGPKRWLQELKKFGIGE